MRGSPLLHALIAFLAIGLLGIPVHRLARASASAAPTPAPVKATATTQVPVAFEFTTPPRSVRVKHLGKVVWSSDAPGASAEAELSLPWPEDGVDLLVEISWPGDAPLSAARVVLTDPTGEEQTRSIWGRGTASEVLTFR